MTNISLEVNMDNSDIERALSLLERSTDFSEFVYQKLGPEGVNISLEDFMKFFSFPEEDFGEHQKLYYNYDTEKMEDKIPGTEENWDSGVLGSDVRYAREVELPESMTAPFNGIVES